jgi:hypothetical protein
LSTSTQIYRLRDFTDGDPLTIQFMGAFRELLAEERFGTLNVSQVVGAMEIMKIELISRLHGVGIKNGH